MTSQDWRDWLAYMHYTRGWTKKRCLTALGCGPNQAVRWSKTDPPLSIGLACSALAADLGTWRKRPLGVRSNG